MDLFLDRYLSHYPIPPRLSRAATLLEDTRKTFLPGRVGAWACLGLMWNALAAGSDFGYDPLGMEHLSIRLVWTSGLIDAGEPPACARASTGIPRQDIETIGQKTRPSVEEKEL
jgi:hypothetical protein